MEEKDIEGRRVEEKNIERRWMEEKKAKDQPDNALLK